MQRNTSVILGDHLAQFVNAQINEGRFESTSEAVRAGLRLLEAQELKLQQLRQVLATGEKQLLSGQFHEADAFISTLIHDL